MKRILTITDIKRLHREAGGTFFNAESQRMYNARVESSANAHGYFVTSEQLGYGKPRYYTVRRFNQETKMIDRVSEFQQYAELGDALSAIANMH